ncbi:Coiled-coil domain-containing protein 112, partial [Pseudolycoriella hygida]
MPRMQKLDQDLQQRLALKTSSLIKYVIIKGFNLLRFMLSEVIRVSMSTKRKLSATAIFSEFIKLKSQQKYLESTQLLIRSDELSLEDIAILTDINNLQEQLKTQVPIFKLNLKNELETVLATIKSFKDLISNPDNILQYDTKEYRDRIIHIDQTFRNVLQRNFEQISQLKEEFCEMETTVLPATYLLNESSKICPTVANTTSCRGLLKLIDKDDNVDVKKFDDYLLANNGHTGGWNDEEHFLFLKLTAKYKDNVDQIVMSVQHIIEDKTEEDIRKHNEWYIKYMELKAKKKSAIENWKNSRMVF